MHRTLPLFLLLSGAATAAPIQIVAAENFYGDVARRLGGDQVAVTSILSNPNQDPHLFEVSASTARALTGADIVVQSGADYDPWMDKLLAASSPGGRTIITVANLVNVRAGDNPHVWYDPATMPLFAKTLHDELVKRDPVHKAMFDANLAAFDTSLKPLTDKVASIRARFTGTGVAATEPVFGYMAAALGLKMINPAFQLAVQNGTEPGARRVAAFQNDLKTRRAKVLLYNLQVTDPATERLKSVAGAAGVPVVGVTETQPAGESYTTWMLGQLTQLERALRQAPK